MKSILFLFTIITIFSCRNAGNSNDDLPYSDTTSTPLAPLLLKEGCYRMVVQRDTAIMQVNINGDRVLADLHYTPYETDASRGVFMGEVEGNELRGWYNFTSEGMQSYRELIFKIMGDSIVEGYGDIVTSNDSAWFKSPQDLRFEISHPFVKFECE